MLVRWIWEGLFSYISIDGCVAVASLQPLPPPIKHTRRSPLISPASENAYGSDSTPPPIIVVTRLNTAEAMEPVRRGEEKGGERMEAERVDDVEDVAERIEEGRGVDLGGGEGCSVRV